MVLPRRYELPADIYSFGVTVLEAAVGHTPYVNQSLQEIAMSKSKGEHAHLLSVDAHGRSFSEVPLLLRVFIKVVGLQ